MKNEKITSYTNDDVNSVLNKIYENVSKDREKTLHLLENVIKKIEKDGPEASFLVQQANYLIDSGTRQNDVLVRLVGVMQRLQTNTIVQMNKEKQLSSEEYNKLLESLDKKEKVSADIKILESEENKISEDLIKIEKNI